MLFPRWSKLRHLLSRRNSRQKIQQLRSRQLHGAPNLESLENRCLLANYALQAELLANNDNAADLKDSSHNIAIQGDLMVIGAKVFTNPNGSQPTTPYSTCATLIFNRITP